MRFVIYLIYSIIVNVLRGIIHKHFSSLPDTARCQIKQVSSPPTTCSRNWDKTSLPRAVEASDVPKARKLQETLSLAVEALTGEGEWVPSMKAGMEIVTGIKVGPPSLPQRPLSAEAKKRIENKFRALKLIK